MRPPGLASFLYPVVCLILLHLQHSMASLHPKHQFCNSEICSGLHVRSRNVDRNAHGITTKSSPYVFVHFNSSVFLDTLLESAPCPPVAKIHLLCESWSPQGHPLTCDERTHILSRCVQNVPVDEICDVIKKCSFDCKAFENLRSLHCHTSPPVPEMLPSISVVTSVLTTALAYDVNATNATDWSLTTNISGGDTVVGNGGKDDEKRLRGEVVIVLTAVSVFGFVFLPLIVYYLLNRDNRTVIARCCSSMWSCCTRGLWSWCKTKLCPTHERFRNEDHKKGEVVEEIVAIAPVRAIELESSPPTRSLDLTNDSGIGCDLDFPEADDQTPEEYRNTPWIQRRSLLIDSESDFDFDWTHL